MAAEFALSVGLQTMGDITRELSYAAVVLSCVFCLLLFTFSPDYIFTQLGLLFTLGADYYLVLSDPIEQLPAIIFFSAVQVFYCVRLLLGHKTMGGRVAHMTVRIAITAVAMLLTLLVLGEGADVLSLVSMFYYANLIMNLIVSFTQCDRSVLLPLGLVLFLLCDTVVGLQVMEKAYFPSLESSPLHQLLHPGYNLPWVFYLPSQVLIPLSLLEMRLRKPHRIEVADYYTV